MKKINNISKVNNSKLLKSMYKGLLALSLTMSLGACSDKEEERNVYIANDISLSGAIDMVSEHSLVDEILGNRNVTLKIGNLYDTELRYMSDRKNLELCIKNEDKYKYISECNNDLEYIGLYLLKVKIIESLGIDANKVDKVTINPNGTCIVSYKEEFKKVLTGNVIVFGEETVIKDYKLVGVDKAISVILTAQIGDFILNDEIDNSYSKLIELLCKVGEVDGKKIIFTYSDELIDIIENKKVKTLTK